MAEVILEMVASGTRCWLWYQAYHGTTLSDTSSLYKKYNIVMTSPQWMVPRVGRYIVLVQVPGTLPVVQRVDLGVQRDVGAFVQEHFLDVACLGVLHANSHAHGADPSSCPGTTVSHIVTVSHAQTACSIDS